MEPIDVYLNKVSKPFLDFYMENKERFDVAKHPHHVGSQRLEGGRKLHTIQVIKKALELNQTFDEKEIIEVCLVHDIWGCEKLPFTDAQRMAIRATKGLHFEDYRHTPHYRFVVLILISDMWSAFINEKDL